MSVKLNRTLLIVLAAGLIAFAGAGCGVYRFNDVGTIPDSIRTVRVNFIENRAPYVNPQLSPNLTDRLKQKIVNQTRLSQTNSDNAHYDIRGTITDYSVSTTGVTTVNGRSTPSLNRLTVTVQMTLTNTLSNQAPTEFTVTRNFDFSANQTIQQAESNLLDEIVRNMTDEIFNHIFSNW